MKAAKVTPLKALQLGLSVDVEAVDPEMQKELAKQLKEDPSGNKSALLNDPSVTEKLIAANAVIGFAAKGDKVGATCALCHAVTDGSVFSLPTGGSIGHRRTGVPTTTLILALYLLQPPTLGLCIRCFNSS
jgi:hypothetical protein